MTLKQRIDRLSAEVDALTKKGTAAATIAGKAALKDQFRALCAHPSVSGIVEAVEVSEGPNELEELRGQLEAAEAEKKKLVTQVVNLQRQVASSKRVDDRAREMLSAMGVNPGVRKETPADLQSDGQPRTAQQFMEQYNAIEDPKAASAFYSQYQHLLK